MFFIRFESQQIENYLGTRKSCDGHVIGAKTQKPMRTRHNTR